ncbi:MAG: hypothetical protein ACXVDV_21145, partial [Bacteroidia bacterium]
HNANYVLGYAYFTEEEKREFSKVEDPTELILQSEDLVARAQKLKNDAKKVRGEEQQRLINTANELIHKSDIEKLAAAEIVAYNNRIEFKLSKNSFLNSITDYNATDSNTVEAKRLFFLALQTFRQATELREEAYAQHTTAAILENLHNAAEKENIAFSDMVKAIDILGRVVPSSFAKR